MQKNGAVAFFHFATAPFRSVINLIERGKKQAEHAEGKIDGRGRDQFLRKRAQAHDRSARRYADAEHGGNGEQDQEKDRADIVMDRLHVSRAEGVGNANAGRDRDGNEDHFENTEKHRHCVGFSACLQG